MKRTIGSRSEVGMLYQYGVTACLAAQLSGNNHVDDYIIYSSENSAGKFDDIVARVKLKDEDDWYLYLIQVKYKETKRLNVSDNLRGKRVEYFLSDYIHCFNDILSNPKLTCRRDIPDDNIRFAVFCDKGIQTPVFLRQDCTFRLSVCRYPEESDDLPFGNKYWKFACKDLEKSEFHQRFFDRCWLYLEQANYSKLNKLIEEACQIKNTIGIINYVKDYFNDDYLYEQGLRKEVFEIELQKIRFADAIPPLTSFAELVDDNRVTIWNEITIKHDITAMNFTQNFPVEACLYSCLVQKVNSLLNINVDWKTFTHNLGNELVQRFLAYSKTKKLRYWIDPPSTVRLLLIELWKCGDLPLILKTHIPLNNFKRYAHLNRSYIILDDWTNRSEEIYNSNMNIFTSLSTIINPELQEEMLKHTLVSPQGRKPITLKNLLRDDEELMSTFTCADMLRMMQRRIPFLKEGYYKGIDYLAFIIEDEGCTEISNRVETYAIGHNFRVSCPPGQTDECVKMIRERADIWPHYTIYHLQKTGEKLVLTHGDPRGLNHRFVDQYGDPLFIADTGECITIIGETTELNELKYIPRQLRRPTLPISFFATKETQICVVSGDRNCIDLNIEISDVDEIINETISIKKKTYFVNIQGKGNPQDYWRQLCRLKYAIFDIYIRDGTLELLRYKNCKNVNYYISYDSGIYSEQDFLREITDESEEIAVVTGDAGIGKSSFLKWLCNTYSTQDYIIFYDLINLQVDLNKSERQGIDLIDFVFKETQKDLPKQYVDFVFNLRKKKKLIWVLDSFDEIRLACEKQVLDLIRVIVKSGAQVVIATRLENCKILMDQFDVRLIKIEPLEEKDCLSYWELDQELLTNISSELATNPLYLNFLKMISVNREELASVTKYTLYEKVINMKVKHCLRATYQILHDSDIERAVLLFEKLALVALFGKEVVERELYWACDKEVFDMTKFGIVIRFADDNHPIFYHRSFVEFLFAQWIAKACKINMYKNTAKYFYKQLFSKNELHILNILFEDYEIHRVIMQGNLVMIKQVVREDSQCWNRIDKLGRTGLHAAAIRCCYSNVFSAVFNVLSFVVTSMLQNNFDMDQPDAVMSWNWSEYIQAQTFNFVYVCNVMEVMRIYVQLHRRKVERDGCPSPVFPTIHFYQIFRSAVKCGAIDMISDLVLLQNYENKIFYSFHRECLGLTPETTSTWTKDSQFEGRLTPLHVACIYGNFPMIQHLVKIGAHIDTADEFRCTPLHYSIMRCNSLREERIYDRNKTTETVKLLLERGANPNTCILGIRKITPLYLAIKTKNTDIVSMLLKTVVDIFHRDDNQNTLLHLAVSLGCVDVVRSLLHYDGLRYLRNEQNETALDIAVKHNHTALIELLSRTDSVASTDEKETRAILLSINMYAGSSERLHHAAYCGNIDLLKVLLRRGNDINLLNCTNGDTPLLAALRSNNVEISTFLLSKGADFRIRDKYGKTPLFIATNHGNIPAVQMILERGDDVNITDLFKWTPLHVATMHNNTDAVKLLLKKGANMDAQNVNGITPLHCAVVYGSEECLELLLENGANPDIPDESGFTPLHFSVKEQHGKSSALLLRKGASVNFRGTLDSTPFLTALHQQDMEMVRLFLENGANLNDEDADGSTSLYYATEKGNIELMKLLIDKGANINAVNKYGVSVFTHAAITNQINSIKFLLKENVNIDRKGGAAALSCSISKRNIEVVQLLLTRGASVNTYDHRYHHTALHVAVEKGDVDIVSLLLENGAHINANSRRWATALHHAVLHDHQNIVKLLIDKGANVNLTSREGATVLLYAIQKESIPIVKLLLEEDADSTKEARLEAVRSAVVIGDIEIVKLLLNKGVDLNIYNENSYTPLYLATRSKRADIVELLIENGADVNIASYNGLTPLVKAVMDREIEITSLFLDNGANVNGYFRDCTALHAVVIEGNVDFVKLLIEKGADVNMKTKDGVTALELAAARDYTNIVELLLEQKANLQIATRNGNVNCEMLPEVEDNKDVIKTLFWAVGKGHLKIIKLCLHYGVNINFQISNGITPLHVAVTNSNEQIVEMLLENGANVNLKSSDGLTPLCFAKLKGDKNIVDLISAFMLSLCAL